MRMNRILFALATIAAMILAGPGSGRVARAGSVMYEVTVDTSSDANGLGLDGTLGALEFQLNPGNSGSPLTTAAITGFTSDGVPGTGANGPQTYGDVTGMLPGTVFMDNGAGNVGGPGLADYYHPFTYGDSISFFLTLSLPTPNPGAASGTTFSFLMYDQSGDTVPPGGGSAFTINVDPASGPGTPQQSIAAPTLTVGMASVPEPSGLVLLGVGVGAGWLAGRARRRRGR